MGGVILTGLIFLSALSRIAEVNQRPKEKRTPEHFENASSLRGSLVELSLFRLVACPERF